MSDLLEQLQVDHRNTARLLKRLEFEIEAFTNGNDKGVGTMRSIVDYLSNYTERIHHPKEDLVYTAMKKKDVACTAIADELDAEHKHLASLTREFTTLLEEVVLGSMMKRETVASSAREYIAHNREHARKEETIAFPLARNTLQANEWAAIARVLPNENDPLFGPQIEPRYSALRDILATHS